ncbi:MAG: hypothetical protein HDT08_03290 [Bacteroidales bacterium]|nr:hypothetical protein [Bacteroidales bacterium]
MSKNQLPFCDQFGNWLRNLGKDETTVKNRLSNVAKINEVYGDLKSYWEKDGFESLIQSLSYSKSDEAEGKPNPSKISINGNIYNGLATYKSALGLYKAFLMSDNVKTDLGPIGNNIRTIISELKQTCTKRSYSRDDVKSIIIAPLVELLNSKLGSFGYEFNEEYTPEQSQTSEGKICRDRYDIMGKSENENLPVVVIEVDTHRSDQVSKKMVSRIALNQDKELIYVSVLYPNNHKNRDAEKKECVKYIDYINILFSMFTEPRKEFIYGLLY